MFCLCSGPPQDGHLDSFDADALLLKSIFFAVFLNEVPRKHPGVLSTLSASSLNMLVGCTCRS